MAFPSHLSISFASGPARSAPAVMCSQHVCHSFPSRTSLRPHTVWPHACSQLLLPRTSVLHTAFWHQFRAHRKLRHVSAAASGATALDPSQSSSGSLSSCSIDENLEALPSLSTACNDELALLARTSEHRNAFAQHSVPLHSSFAHSSSPESSGSLVHECSHVQEMLNADNSEMLPCTFATRSSQELASYAGTEDEGTSYAGTEDEGIADELTSEHKHQEGSFANGVSGRLSSLFRSLRPGSKVGMPSMSSILSSLTKDRSAGLVLLNIMVFLMGSNWVVLKHSGQVLDPYVFASLRFMLAAMAFFPILPAAVRNPAVLKAGVELGMWSGLGYLTQSAGLQMTDASRAALLSTFTVLGVPLLAGMNGRQVKPLVWLGGIAALVGTSFLEQSGTPPNVGDLFSIASAMFFAAQLYRTEVFARELPKDATLQVLSVTLSTCALFTVSLAAVTHPSELQMLSHSAATGVKTTIGALLGDVKPHVHMWSSHMFQDVVSQLHVYADRVVALVHGTPSHPEEDMPWAELAWTSWCSTDLVLMLEMYALNSVSSTEAAMIYSMEPVTGALFAYCFLGERWGPLGWTGAAIILAASIFTQMHGAVEEEAAK